MKKNKIKLFIIMMVALVCLSSFSFAKSLDKDKLYQIYNPTTAASVICNSEGKVILKTMNPMNEYIEIINDEKTDKQGLIYKRIEGETKVDNKFYNDNGELEYEYSYPSYRMELYDLEGNFTSFNQENVSYISFLLGNKVVYYKDVENATNREVFIYNIDTKTEEKLDLPVLESVKDKKLLIKSTYSYDNNTNNKKMVIMDYDFNNVKTIDNYSYDSLMQLKDKSFLRVIKYNEEKDRNFYNLLDDDYNFLFEEDAEEMLWTDDNNILDFKTTSYHIVYDLNKMEYIQKEINEVNENEDIINKKIEEGQLSTMVGDNNRYYDNSENKTKIYDKDLNLIKEIDKYYSFIDYYEYNGQVIYQGYNGYYDEVEDRSIEQIDLYDENLNIKLENVTSVNMFQEDGLFQVDNKIYDFKFNIVKQFEDGFKDRMQRYKVGDNIFYDNRYTKEYELNEVYNVYDKNFDIIYENVNDTIFYMENGRYFIIKDGKTYIYNTDRKLIKTLDGALNIYEDYEGKYLISYNKDTKRYSVLDENYNYILSNYKYLSNLQEDYCTFQNGFRYGFIDYEGNVLISFSIFDTMNEEKKDRISYY